MTPPPARAERHVAGGDVPVLAGGPAVRLEVKESCHQSHRRRFTGARLAFGVSHAGDFGGYSIREAKLGI